MTCRNAFQLWFFLLLKSSIRRRERGNQSWIEFPIQSQLNWKSSHLAPKSFIRGEINFLKQMRCSSRSSRLNRQGCCMIDVLTCYWSNTVGRCMISSWNCRAHHKICTPEQISTNQTGGEIGLGRYLLRFLIRYMCLLITMKIYGGWYQRPLRKLLYFIAN